MFEALGKFLYGNVNLLLGVGSHESDTHKGVIGSTSRRNYGIYENAFVECQFGDNECLFLVAHIEGDNGRFGIANSRKRASA